MFTALITYGKLFHPLNSNCFKTCELLKKYVFTPSPKFVVCGSLATFCGSRLYSLRSIHWYPSHLQHANGSQITPRRPPQWRTLTPADASGLSFFLIRRSDKQTSSCRHACRSYVCREVCTQLLYTLCSYSYHATRSSAFCLGFAFSTRRTSVSYDFRCRSPMG